VAKILVSKRLFARIGKLSVIPCAIHMSILVPKPEKKNKN
jgi:hypothetical protein